jgi:hypothetical protein
VLGSGLPTGVAMPEMQRRPQLQRPSREQAGITAVCTCIELVATRTRNSLAIINSLLF